MLVSSFGNFAYTRSINVDNALKYFIAVSAEYSSNRSAGSYPVTIPYFP
jgi:hypothetical protein